MLRLTTIFVLLLVAGACAGPQVNFKSEAEFEAYLNDPSNGFIESDETDELLCEARLIPTSNLNSEQLTVQFRINRKDGTPVLKSGGASKEEALEREGYLSFELAQDVWLESDAKTYPCIFHHYERNYNIKPSIDVFFGFKAFKPTDDVYLVYRDNLFGQGLVKIKFNKDLFINYHVN